jgi:hypothetical protein
MAIVIGHCNRSADGGKGDDDDDSDDDDDDEEEVGNFIYAQIMRQLQISNAATIAAYHALLNTLPYTHTTAALLPTSKDPVEGLYNYLKRHGTATLKLNGCTVSTPERIVEIEREVLPTSFPGDEDAASYSSFNLAKKYGVKMTAAIALIALESMLHGKKCAEYLVKRVHPLVVSVWRMLKRRERRPPYAILSKVAFGQLPVHDILACLMRLYLVRAIEAYRAAPQGGDMGLYLPLTRLMKILFMMGVVEGDRSELKGEFLDELCPYSTIAAVMGIECKHTTQSRWKVNEEQLQKLADDKKVLLLVRDNVIHVFTALGLMNHLKKNHIKSIRLSDLPNFDDPAQVGGDESSLQRWAFKCESPEEATKILVEHFLCSTATLEILSRILKHCNALNWTGADWCDLYKEQEQDLSVLLSPLSAFLKRALPLEMLEALENAGNSSELLLATGIARDYLESKKVVGCSLQMWDPFSLNNPTTVAYCTNFTSLSFVYDLLLKLGFSVRITHDDTNVHSLEVESKQRPGTWIKCLVRGCLDRHVVPGERWEPGFDCGVEANPVGNVHGTLYPPPRDQYAIAFFVALRTVNGVVVVDDVFCSSQFFLENVLLNAYGGAGLWSMTVYDTGVPSEGRTRDIYDLMHVDLSCEASVSKLIELQAPVAVTVLDSNSIPPNAAALYKKRSPSSFDVSKLNERIAAYPRLLVDLAAIERVEISKISRKMVEKVFKKVVGKIAREENRLLQLAIAERKRIERILREAAAARKREEKAAAAARKQAEKAAAATRKQEEREAAVARKRSEEEELENETLEARVLREKAEHELKSAARRLRKAIKSEEEAADAAVEALAVFSTARDIWKASGGRRSEIHMDLVKKKARTAEDRKNKAIEFTQKRRAEYELKLERTKKPRN